MKVPNRGKSIPRNQNGKALTRLIEKMGRGEVEVLLGDWNGSELSEDGTKIYFMDTRGGSGKFSYTKGEFFGWLFGDDPTNPSEYIQEQEWVERVRLAREIAFEGKTDKPD